MIVLAAMDRWRGDSLFEKIALTYGRVPLFYFILQMFVAHGMGLVLSLLAGKDVGYLFMNFPDFATNAPPDNGFPLWVVYLAWLAGLIILYPICAWYGRIKMRSRNPLFSYL